MSLTVDIALKAAFDALLEKPEGEQLRLLIEYVGSQNKQKSALATHLLVGAGPGVVPLLIRQAFARIKRPAHAVRLLDIVSRIGGPVDATHRMLILSATALPNKRISDRCSRLLVELGHALANQPRGTRPASERDVLRSICESTVSASMPQ